jgi:hypothetical protein
LCWSREKKVSDRKNARNKLIQLMENYGDVDKERRRTSLVIIVGEFSAKIFPAMQIKISILFSHFPIPIHCSR